MQIYGPVSLHGPQSLGAPHSARYSQPTPPSRGASSTDEVQISAQAEMASQLSGSSDIRHERVQALRAAIADGSYDTDAKLDAALDRMLDEIA